ncbi:MAG: glycosyltransferase family 4 protein [Ignavibacteria bacterium]|jgi:glycosyltransferase involved in cell wall biosynthesis
MKILYSCLSNSWGGMEMVTINSIKQLKAKSINVELLCVSGSRIHMEANNLGIIIYPVKASGYVHPLLVLKLISIFRQGKYDLIHTHASKDLWLLVPALKMGRFDTVLIFTKHIGSFINKQDKIHNWLYNRVNCALAISNVIKQNLIETTSLSENKIVLHFSGADAKKFNPLTVDPKKVRNKFEIEDNEMLLGMIARYSPGKGHELFIEAARVLSKKYNNLKFLSIGEASKGEDEYAHDIKELANKYDLKNIIFPGFRHDIPDILAAMDIFIFPSMAEAFGMALVEAMAMGKPCVCTKSDGVLDIATDNETGLLFEKNNVNDMIDKIETLICSKEIRVKLGNAARERALLLFNSENQFDRLIEIYKSFLDN